MRCLPSRGRQLGDAMGWPFVEYRQDLHEVGAHIDFQAAAGFHDGEDGGHFGAGFLAADVQPVFPVMLSSA